MNKNKMKRAVAVILGCCLVISAGAQTYTVSVAEQQNCSVAVSPQNYSTGDVVTVTITPADGAIFNSFHVYCQCSESEWWAAQSSRTIIRTRASVFSYRLDIWNIDGHEDEPVQVTEGIQYTFTMPARNVEIEALYLSGSAQYDITRASALNGTVGTDVNRAMAGETVTVTASPSAGYMVDDVKVYERIDGLYDNETDFIRTGATSFTFTMPADPVNIHVTFKTEPAVFDLSESTGINPYNVYDIQGKTASFTRSFTGGKASTICLPFAMTYIAGGNVYEFRDIIKESNVWVANMVEVIATEAGKPYLYVPNATGAVEFGGTVPNDITVDAGTSESNVSGGTWTFHGTYERLTYGTAPLTGRVFGFAASGGTATDGVTEVTAGQFVKAGAGAYMPPFRAYLTYTGDGSAYRAPSRDGSEAEDIPDRILVRLLASDGTVTGVGVLDTATGEVFVERWFDLTGRPLEGTPTAPGIYINGNGKKVVIR
jgi:hypothetical protein